MSLRDDYPLLYEEAKRFDFAERLGGCTDPLLREIDAAMRELHDARATLDATATGRSERVISVKDTPSAQT